MSVLQLARTLASVAATVLGGVLAGCSAISADGSLLGIVTPYRIDIVQGNVVTKEQLALVKPGMSRVQVRDLLGSPLLTDPFHGDRWDYVFTIQRPGTQPQRRSIVARFEGDRLLNVEAPELPSEREFVALISRARGGKAPQLELTAEERAALPVPPKAPAPAPAPEPEAGPLRAYPPLEPN